MKAGLRCEGGAKIYMSAGQEQQESGIRTIV